MSDFSPPKDHVMCLATATMGSAYKAFAVEMAAFPGEVVLSLGQGPGVDLRALAEAVGPTGMVIEINGDPTYVAEMRAYTSDLAGQINIMKGDFHRLQLKSKTVDSVIADGVLQYAARPETVLQDIRRVLRPGGMIVLMEADWDTLIIDSTDLSVARTYSRFVADRLVRNPCVGRRLAGMVAQEGFEVSKVIPITPIFRSMADAEPILGLHHTTQLAVDAGYIEPNAVGRWLDELASATFFASVTLFLVVALNRPGFSGGCLV